MKLKTMLLLAIAATALTLSSCESLNGDCDNARPKGKCSGSNTTGTTTTDTTTTTGT